MGMKETAAETIARLKAEVRRLRRLLGIREPDPDPEPGPSVPGGVSRNPGDGDRRYDHSRRWWPKRD